MHTNDSSTFDGQGKKTCHKSGSKEYALKPQVLLIRGIVINVSFNGGKVKFSQKIWCTKQLYIKYAGENLFSIA